VRDEDGVPLLELGQHRRGLGRDDDAGEDAAIVALNQLLTLAHAGGGIALRVLVDELDRLPDQAALRIGHFLDQLAGADHLAAQQGIAAGDHGRDAYLDRSGRGRVPQIGRCGDQRRDGGCRLQDRAPRHRLSCHHGYLPDCQIFVQACYRPACIETTYSSSTVLKSAGTMISSSSQSSE
jgi:hypothetical protein